MAIDLNKLQKKIDKVLEHDFGFEAMENFDSDEMEKCADLIIKKNITPNLDNQ